MQVFDLHYATGKPAGDCPRVEETPWEKQVFDLRPTRLICPRVKDPLLLFGRILLNIVNILLHLTNLP